LNSYAPNYLSISGLTGFSKNKEGNTELSIHVETIDRDSGEVVKSILDNPNYTIGSTDSSDVRVKLDYLPIVNSYNAIVRVIWRDKLSDKKLIVYFDK
jgi:pSer/pThr/pTyr-binding forkhead associated (FHA) protein